jgi:glycosyltransferase involved in cell wall biosynthesis
VSQAGLSEIIIIDDCSTEELVREKLIKWANFDDRIKLIFNDTNIGIAESQNRGVALATSEYVGFLDCDDILQSNASLALCSAIKDNDSDYYFTDRYNIDEKGALSGHIKYGGYDWIAPSSNIKLDLFLGMVASHWKVIRKSSYISAGGSSTELTGVQDWDLALKLLHSSSFHYVQEPLYRHRIHSNSVTSSAMMGQLWKTNISRRNYLERLRDQITSEHLSTIITTEELTLEHLKQLAPSLLKGERFVLDRQNRKLSINEINLIREFNSFFEEIHLCDTDSVSVLGYLWSEKSLVGPF